MNCKHNERGQTAAGVIFGLIIVAVVVALFGYFSFSEKVERGKIGLRYQAGIEQGEKYIGTIKPGSDRFFNGWGNKLYEYPTTDRNYNVSSEGEGDKGAPDTMSASTADGVRVTYEFNVRYKLNLDKIREFHERYDPKYDVHTDDGWADYLNQEFRQALQSSLQDASVDHKAVDIFTKGAARSDIEAAIGKSLRAKVRYFCGVEGEGKCSDLNVSIKQVDVPDNIKDALQKTQLAAQSLKTAREEAERLRIEAKGKADAKKEEAAAILTLDRALKRAGNSDAYLQLKYIEALAASAEAGGLIVVPPGNTVMLPSGK